MVLASAMRVLSATDANEPFRFNMKKTTG